MPSTYNLTTTPMIWPKVADTSLEGFWPLEEGKFSTVSVDKSGKSHTLTTLTDIEWGAGISGACLSFADRAAARSALGAAIDGSAFTAFTISFWATKAAAATDTEYILSWTDEAAEGISFHCAIAEDDLKVTFWRAGALSESITPYWKLEDAWHLYTLTFTLATKKWIAYIDGAAWSNGTLTDIPVLPNNKLVLGNADTPVAANGWIGLIDEVRLYSAVLTPAEVGYLYRNPGQLVVGPYDTTGLAQILSRATLTIYDGKQPRNVDYQLVDNNVMAVFTFPTAVLGNYGATQINVLDEFPSVTWLRAGTPTFARVTSTPPEIPVFDCSVGQSGTDLIIKESPVRARDTARIAHGTPDQFAGFLKVEL